MTDQAKELGKQPINSTTTMWEDCKITVVGLTKREYFAGLALQGLLHNSWIKYHEATKMAVEYADELLEELCKEEI